jgi:hypothetical protein
MPIDAESIETLLGRSLDDDQESRRDILDLAAAPGLPRFREAPVGRISDIDSYARLVVEKFLGGNAPESHCFSGDPMQLQLLDSGSGSQPLGADVEKLVQNISGCLRHFLETAQDLTLGQHLASLPPAERAAFFNAFVADARVSSAYEGIDLNVEGMTDRLRTAVETHCPELFQAQSA